MEQIWMADDGSWGTGQIVVMVVDESTIDRIGDMSDAERRDMVLGHRVGLAKCGHPPFNQNARCAEMVCWNYVNKHPKDPIPYLVKGGVTEV